MRSANPTKPAPAVLCDRTGVYFDAQLAACGQRMWQGPPDSRRRASEREALAAGAANLEEVTLVDRCAEFAPEIAEGAASRGQLGCKVTRYFDGVRAVVFRARTPRNCTGDVGSRRFDAERSSASIQRSRKLVTHRARCLAAQYLWTFTKRDKFESSDAVWSAWGRFKRLMRKRFGRSFRYVAVPELHKDGVTWHLHVLLDRFYLVESLRVLWYRALGGRGNERGEETPGQVNVKALRGGRSSSRRAALYVAKYVGKGFERGGANRRVFSTSDGLEPVSVNRWHCPIDSGIVDFTDQVEGWLTRLMGIGRVYPRYFFREGWECAIIEAPLPSSAAAG